MNAKTLTVIARVKAKHGKEDAVRRELLSLVAPSRMDAGCVNYDLHQSVESPGTFVFHENWTSESLFEAHLQQVHVQKVLANLDQLVAEPAQITLWEKIS